VHGVVGSADAPPRGELVLWTEDVDDQIAFLSAKGVRVLSPPHDFAGSLRAAWIADF
jgi:hypothetical protein